MDFLVANAHTVFLFGENTRIHGAVENVILVNQRPLIHFFIRALPIIPMYDFSNIGLFYKSHWYYLLATIIFCCATC